MKTKTNKQLTPKQQRQRLLKALSLLREIQEEHNSPQRSYRDLDPFTQDEEWHRYWRTHPNLNKEMTAWRSGPMLLALPVTDAHAFHTEEEWHYFYFYYGNARSYYHATPTASILYQTEPVPDAAVIMKAWFDLFEQAQTLKVSFIYAPWMPSDVMRALNHWLSSCKVTFRLRGRLELPRKLAEREASNTRVPARRR